MQTLPDYLTGEANTFIVEQLVHSTKRYAITATTEGEAREIYNQFNRSKRGSKEYLPITLIEEWEDQVEFNDIWKE